MQTLDMTHLWSPAPCQTILHVVNEEFPFIWPQIFTDFLVSFANFSDPLIPLLVHQLPILDLVRILGVIQYLLPWQF